MVASIDDTTIYVFREAVAEWYKVGSVGSD